MTRREEIQWEAGGIVNRMIERGFSENYDTYYQAFQDGAKWADKTMIDKACEWLKLNAEDYVVTCYDKGELDSEGLLMDFRKAMEE